MNPQAMPVTTQPGKIGLYVHIPYCSHTCRYCDFYSQVGLPHEFDAFIDTLLAELRLVWREFRCDEHEVDTVFIGGGTPSLLHPGQWRRLMNGLCSQTRLSAGAEITIECNPDSFSTDKAVCWQECGVNRLSLGVQSLDERELRFLGRRHSAAIALEALNSPVLAGFESVNVDIIYGLPAQTPRTLEHTCAALMGNHRITHISAYELTLHDHTPLWAQRHRYRFPGDEFIIDLARLIGDLARSHGFDRYEISNYARPGFACRHNSAYWLHKPYVGLGPSAHSFVNNRRYANVCDTQRWSASVRRGRRELSLCERLNPATLLQEAIFLRLRMMAGIDDAEFEQHYAQPFASGHRRYTLERLIERGLLHRTHGRWQLTENGIALADGVARELI
ncbi:MAG: radical SAM family heme chaperone HemW [Chitinivibrionales bacterium]|nr:radical SAM family heme chaperone HemW [Chitinivibrionales bacterium]